MAEFGEFFYDGVEICNVTDDSWDESIKTETITVYKNERNPGTLTRGSSKEINASINCVEVQPEQDKALYNTIRAINDENGSAPLVFNYWDKSVTFIGAKNAKLSYKGSSEKGRDYSLEFSAVDVKQEWK